MGTETSGHGTSTPDAAPRRVISYATHRQVERDFWRQLNGTIASGARRICEIGGGARPLLSVERIAEERLGYVVLDESAEELAASEGYDRVQASILDRRRIEELAETRGPFDLVVSRWTAEHIPDGRGFHQAVHRLLRPGGTALHMSSTLYALPFLVNRLLSDAMSTRLLFRVCTERGEKFRPYYSWCRGPSARQLRRLEATGFAVRFYGGYFGHTFYRQIPPLHRLHGRIADALVRHPLPVLTSFAVLALERTD
jgi:SAM-dependent methyltransferase